MATNKSKEALKLALEALEYFSEISPNMAGKAHAEDAITAIKQALAAQHEPENEPFVSLASVQEPVAQPASEEDMRVYRAIADNYRKDLTAPPAQPAPVQPVAWRWVNPKGWLTYGEAPHDTFKSTPLYTTQPAQPAPVTEGWKQVPVEPTDEMLDAAQAVVTDIYRVDADRVYTAMVQAAHGITKGQPCKS
jgi:hypothetical protein